MERDSACKSHDKVNILTVAGSREIHCQPVPSLGLCQQHALSHPLKQPITAHTHSHKSESECKCLTCNQKPSGSQFSLLH